MKILVINNHTKHLPDLTAALAGHDLEIREYRPGMDFACASKDLIVLSGGGGEGLEIHDEHKPGKLWYEDQMRFVKNCQKPIIGICMGFEVVSRAYGAKVAKMQRGVDQIFMEFSTTPAGERLLGKTRIKQFEAHDWHVQQAPKGFKVLAKSDIGIEIIQHEKLPIFATQFHPEKGGTLQLKGLVNQIYISARA